MKRTKILSSVLAISLIALGVIPGTVGFASADPNPLSKYPVDASVSRTSAVADGKSNITVEAFIYGYQCAGQSQPQETASCPDGTTSTQKVGLPNRWIGVYPTGRGNIYSDLTIGAGVTYLTSDSSGHAAFQVASTVAETKKFQFTDHVLGIAPSYAPTQTVVFTEPPVSSPIESPTESTVVQAGVPLLSKVEVNGKRVNTSDTISIKANQTLVLTGTSAPKGTVRLAISSKSDKTVNVDVDDQGAWTYKLSKPSAGSYTINATATDPQSSQPSLEVVLTSFSVTAVSKKAPTEAKQDSKPVSQSRVWAWIAAGVIVLVAVAVFWTLRKRRSRVQQPEDNDLSD